MTHRKRHNGTVGARWSGYGLRTAVIAFLVVPLLLLAALGGWWALSLLEREAGERMEEDLELIARALQSPLSRALALGREGAVNEALESAFGFARVYGAYVYGPNGDRVAASGPDAARMTRGRVAELTEEGSEGGQFDEQDGRELYSYFVPLVDSGGRIIGLLQVTRRGSDFDYYLNEIRHRGMLILGAAAAMMVLVVYAGHHFGVGRHFRAMRRRLDEVGRGHRERRLAVEGPWELRQLASEINRVLDRVRESEQELMAQREKEQALETRLHQSEKMAAIGQLAAGVAHELGSPMAVVAGKAQRAQRRAGEPDVAQALADIREQVGRMERTVSQLIDFGRGYSARRRPEAVGRIARAAVQQVEDEAAAGNVSLEVVGEEPGPEVEADRLRLEQAVHNLLSNAVQATPGGQVHVEWRHRGDEVVLWVEDDGPGIDEALRNRLFEPFFTTKPVGSGTGLGLAVVQGAVTEHGGSIEVEVGPELGGSRFTITLPAIRGGA